MAASRWSMAFQGFVNEYKTQNEMEPLPSLRLGANAEGAGLDDGAGGSIDSRQLESFSPEAILAVCRETEIILQDLEEINIPEAQKNHIQKLYVRMAFDRLYSQIISETKMKPEGPRFYQDVITAIASAYINNSNQIPRQHQIIQELEYLTAMRYRLDKKENPKAILNPYALNILKKFGGDKDYMMALGKEIKAETSSLALERIIRSINMFSQIYQDRRAVVSGRSSGEKSGFFKAFGRSAYDKSSQFFKLQGEIQIQILNQLPADRNETAVKKATQQIAKKLEAVFEKWTGKNKKKGNPIEYLNRMPDSHDSVRMVIILLQKIYDAGLATPKFDFSQLKKLDSRDTPFYPALDESFGEIEERKMAIAPSSVSPSSGRSG